MKKLTVFILMLLFSLTAYGGSIDTDLIYDDSALVFAASLEDFEITYVEDDYPNTVCNIHLKVLKKLKGDIEEGELRTFKDVNFGKIVPEKGMELFVGRLNSNNTYIYALEPIENGKLVLKERNNQSLAEQMQYFIDEGAYERAEIKRLNLGKKQTLSEFLGEGLKNAESISVSDGTETVNADKKKFLKLAEKIILTDVKDSYPKAMHEEFIYIMCHPSEGESPYVAVSIYGEADRYAPFMSRLPMKDFTMSREDAKKLFSLHPSYKEESAPVLPAVIIAAIIVIVILFLIIKRRKNV